MHYHVQEKLYKKMYCLKMLWQLSEFSYSERYRDLIEAADTITDMKNSAQNVSFIGVMSHR